MLSTDDVPNGSNSKEMGRSTIRIQRSSYVVWLVLVYAALVLCSWVVLCKMTYQPISFGHYGYRDSNSTYWVTHNNGPDQRDRNERWFKAAQVVQSIVGLLTILLTSAVCSSAAVV